MQNEPYHEKNNMTQKDNKSETISELAHRHLLDENHTTSDEELKNARIEFNDDHDTSIEGLSEMSEIDNNTLLPPLPFEKNNDDLDNKTSDEDSRKKSPPNPYDILGS